MVDRDVTGSNGADVIPFRGIDELQCTTEAGNRYSETMAPHVVMACARLGLASEFLPNFTQHIKDINIVFYRERQNLGFEQTASLDVMRSNSEKQGTPGPYKRVLLISEESIRRRKRLLHEIIPLSVAKEPHSQEFSSITQQHIDTQKPYTDLAVDWLFYEACAEALGNAVHMQQNYPNYIEDFHGQSNFYKAETTVSANYLVSVGATEFSVKEDAKDFKKGFGFMMLHDALLAKGIVRTATQANWIINSLREQFKDAHRSEEIAARLQALIPSKDLTREYGEFALAVCDPDIYLDDEEDITQ